MSAGLLLGVRREHAIDATAAAATALGSRGDRAAAAAPNGSTPDDKLKVARRHPPRRGGRQLPPGRPANLGRSARLGRIVPEVVVRHGARTAAEHAVRLGAQELRPAGADPARRRPEPRASQHGRDRGGRDADSELEQLTLDTHVAPARGLSRQPPDQAARRGRKRRTAGPATATSPTSLKQCPVPAASVCGLTAKQDHRSGGSSRLTAASKARSTVVYCGRFPPRLRIASCWRSTTISSSRSPPPRASTPTRKQRSRYSKDISKTPSLNRPGRDHQHGRPGRNRISLPHTLWKDGSEYWHPSRSSCERISG